VRSADDRIHRHLQTTDWPVPGTAFTKFHLDAANRTLGFAAPDSAAQVTYPAMSEGVTFTSAPLERDMEIAGPLKAKLRLSSSTPDMDLFCTVLAFDPSGREITFSSNMGFIPISQGWLRITQRKLDPKRSSRWQPVHPHDERQPLAPGKAVDAEVEIWPTGAYLPRGSRVALVLQGKDFEGFGKPGSSDSGIFTHVDPVDRPAERYSGDHSVHTGGGAECYLQLPVIPAG
jgi:predicted acyl esterase